MTLHDLLKKRVSPGSTNTGRDCSLGFTAAISYGARVSTEAGEESPNVFFSKISKDKGTSVLYQKNFFKQTKKLSPKRAPAEFYSACSHRNRA